MKYVNYFLYCIILSNGWSQGGDELTIDLNIRDKDYMDPSFPNGPSEDDDKDDDESQLDYVDRSFPNGHSEHDYDGDYGSQKACKMDKILTKQCKCGKEKCGKFNGMCIDGTCMEACKRNVGSTKCMCGKVQCKNRNMTCIGGKCKEVDDACKGRSGAKIRSPEDSCNWCGCNKKGKLGFCTLMECPEPSIA